MDFVALVDRSEVGNAALDGVGPDGDRLGVSIAFNPVSSVEYPDGIMRTRVELLEIAIVDQLSYQGAYLYARGDPPPLDDEVA